MALTSMTGFADLRRRRRAASAWTWEARSVNGRGLDLRLRLPEGFEALDAPIRAARGAGARARLGHGDAAARRGAPAAALPRLNPEALEAAVGAALGGRGGGGAAGLDLAPMTAADLLAVRGVLEAEAAAPAENAALLARAGRRDRAAARRARGGARRRGRGAGARCSRRRSTGSRRWRAAARETAEARAGRSGRAAARAGSRRCWRRPRPVDEARLAQELALLAVRADVTEELDRLDAHVAAARALIAGDGPVGRKLDFLMQEFNREANTLCSKAGASDLTAIGLELKVVIDQMREQVQNVE